MKRDALSARILALSALALAAKPLPAAINLIQDGGFEGAVPAWSSSKSALALDPAAAETGAQGLRLDSAYAWCPYGATYTLAAGSLQNGTLYEVGARVRLAADEAGYADLDLGLIKNNASSTWIDGEQSSYDGRTYTDRWTTLFGVVKANFAATDTIKLCISGGLGKTVYIDNVYVAPLTRTEIGYQPPTALDVDALVRASGTRLVLGPNDATFVLKGANVYQYDPGDDLSPALTNYKFKNVKADSYAELAALGFNSVRLMLAYNLFEDDAAPGVYKEEGWAMLDRHIQWAKAHGLRLILDMHVPQGGYQSASGFKGFGSRADLKKRLEDLWVAIAGRYRNETTIVGYDLINEPYVNHWFDYAATVIEKIRAVDPHHLVVVEVSFHPDDAGMYRLADPNVLYDVHWYEPWSWAGSHTNNTPYVGNVETFKQELRDGEGLQVFYDSATDRFTVPFNVGEYGITFEKYEIAGVNGAAWLADANAAFDHFGISRQLFAYNEGNFGIYRGWNSYPREHTSTTAALLAALPEVNGAEPPPPPPVPVLADLNLASFAVDNPAPVAGGIVNLSFAVGNLSTDAALNARLSLQLPAGVQWVSGPADCAVASSNLVCSFGTLESGGTRTRSVALRPTTAGSFILTGTAGADTQDPNAANNSASLALIVTAPPPPAGQNADLVLTQFKATNLSPKAGSAAEFIFIIKNLGADAAANTRFVLPLPAGLNWVSGPTECSVAASAVVCSYGSLAKGASRTRYLYLRPAAAGALALSGSAQADTQDPVPTNNAKTLNLTVMP
jgi:uncharacterized repeat protein (TIGR01451 family)